MHFVFHILILEKDIIKREIADLKIANQFEFKKEK